jgi:hypothetical protein
MAHDIFISYSHRDKPIADAVCANLEGDGIRCWIAPRDIAPGLDWPTAISNAISTSRVMVLIFSANSNSSNDVSRELILAANNNLIIIPFKIDNIAPEPGKQYYLARTHWLDAMNPPTQEQINKLVGYVRSFLSEQIYPGPVQPAMATEPPSTEVIQPFPKVKPSLSQPEKVGSTRLQKGTKGKSIWIWGILLMLVIAGGSILAVLTFGQVITPTRTFTPTLVIPSPSIINPTLTITLTKTPFPTAIKTLPPNWKTDFGQPILDAIANRSPSFQDDFGFGSAGWQAFDFCGNRMEYVEGELVVTDCWLRRPNNNYTDFVIEYDARFFPGGTGDWYFGFREIGGGGHSLKFEFSGDVTLRYIIARGNEVANDFSRAANPSNQINHILVIGKGSNFAIYLNNVPLSHFSSSYLNFGDFRFAANETILAIDNFKIWNIADISLP